MTPPLLRFAPSPTGSLHLGGLRTALYNHLYARRLGGKWILRVEDTDASRFVEGSVDGIRRALAWAGLDYDFGPGRAGPHGPYYQSERLDLYQTYSKKLLDSGHAYRCFCTPAELEQKRESLARKGSNHTYDKACLHLTEEEVGRRLRLGHKHVVRLNDGNVPPRPGAEDMVFGQLKDSHLSLATDPVLLKSDLFPTYHLASVVDDHEMGITHVLRGEEWLPSLSLHLDIYSCLSLPPPTCAHLPILLNPDGTKMSKRKGDVSVVDFIERGWEPHPVLNWLALTGWGRGRHRHAHAGAEASSTVVEAEAETEAHSESTSLMSLEQLISEFEPSVLTHKRPILDPQRLFHLSKQHLQTLSESEEGLRYLAERAQMPVRETFPTSKFTDVEYLMKVIKTMGLRIVNVFDIPGQVPYAFEEPDLRTEEAREMVSGVPIALYNDILHLSKTALEETPGNWEYVSFSDILHDISSRAQSEFKDHSELKGEGGGKAGLSRGVVMKVLRHALSGMKSGPSLVEIMEVVGRHRVLGRLSRVRNE